MGEKKSTLSNLLQLFLSCRQGDTERTSLALQEGGEAGVELKWEMEKNRQRGAEPPCVCVQTPVPIMSVHIYTPHLCTFKYRPAFTCDKAAQREFIHYCCYWQELFLPVPKYKGKKSVLLFHAKLYKMPVHRLMKKMHEFG